MELQLIVLAGGKQGTEIPLKKDKFIIGRARECTLRAASEAISRRHCAILRANGVWTVRDLGSRNGTYVNDSRIEQETPLSIGDELRIGPLHFRVAERAPAASADAPAEPASKGEQKLSKRPPVKDVADAAQRTVAATGGKLTEDDISRWLLGNMDVDEEETLKETRNLRMEETTTLNPARQQGEPEAAAADESQSTTIDKSADESESGGKKGWGWLKLGKGAAKKTPGKLPPRAGDQPSKDSCEAAADILREMTRRR